MLSPPHHGLVTGERAARSSSRGFFKGDASFGDGPKSKSCKGECEC
jgi:hypothetical protein